MPADRGAIGRALPSVTVTVEASQLLLFAKATGETRPAYAAGERPLVPPTFLFGLEMRQPDPFAWLADIGVDLRWVLHGEQAFAYHSLARAGDTLVATPQISDIFAKKGGALEFIVKQTEVTRTDGSPVADLTSVLIARDRQVRP